MVLNLRAGRADQHRRACRLSGAFYIANTEGKPDVLYEDRDKLWAIVLEMATDLVS